VVTTGSGLKVMSESGVETNIVVMKEAILRFKKLVVRYSLRAVAAFLCVSQERLIVDVSN
jgi:hypothetical protein